jgi:tRNA (adenine37-N6)-methyltransferase
MPITFAILFHIKKFDLIVPTVMVLFMKKFCFFPRRGHMNIAFKPIGFLKTDALPVPRHWTISEVDGEIVIDEAYTKGLKDIHKSQDIVVIFHFHQSPQFTANHLIQKPPHRKEQLGVFSTCSPIRPNPIGISVVRVTNIEENIIYVKGLDMVDGTPILDIKPLTGLKRDTVIHGNAL